MTQNPNISWVHLQHLPPEDTLQLVDKLLACPTMSDRHSRDSVVNMLDKQVANSITRSPIDKWDVTHIVKTCLNHPGQLRALIKIVEYYEGDSLPMKALNTFLEEIAIAQAIEQTIGKEFFDELKQITQGIRISKDVLNGIYMQSVSRSPDWPLPDTQGSDETKTLVLMLRELAQHAQKKHIVEFVERLIPYVSEPAVQQSLRSWLNRAKSAFALDQKDLNALPEPGRSPALLLKFIPDVNAPELVSIQACFLGEQEEYNKVLHVDEEPRSYETIPALLDQLLVDCRRYVRDRRQKLTVEVFFPATFLNYDIDQWRITAGLSGKISIIKYFPLVVRSLDRVMSEDTIAGEIIRDQWQQNWLRFKQQAGTPFQPYYLGADTSEQEDLLGDLLDVHCLALTFAPPAVFDEDRPHIFLKMIDAGIPIAFWPHCAIEQMDEQAIEQMYRVFWSAGAIPELPTMIWEKRRRKAEHLLFHHLVLLWDDPDRLPGEWFTAQLGTEVQDE